MFKDLDLSFAVITETWFHQSHQLTELTGSMQGEHGLTMINKMRKKQGAANPGGASITKTELSSPSTR